MAYNNSNTNKQNRDIKYVNRDFDDLKTSLVNFSKTYFPNVYSDFTENSPGMLFMEMAAYVGDVLSFYQDNQIQENFIQYARQTDNLYSLAYMLGYTPKATAASVVEVDIFQQVPADSDGNPDYSYAVQFLANTPVKSAAGEGFLIQDAVDFSFSSSLDPTEVSVYQIKGNAPQYFLLKKKRKAISGTIKSSTFTFTDPEKFPTVEINTNNIIKVLDIFDSDNNQYYEVPYLAQETILDSVRNTSFNDNNYSSDSANTPYLLRLKKVSRRFVSRFLDSSTLQLQFGAGTNTQNNDEEIIPNPNNVGIGLPQTQDKLKTAFSPSNFLFTKTYGIAPSNTTLTVRYLTGGGVGSNISANTLTQISNKSNIKFLNDNLDTTAASYVFDSVAINNPTAGSGGGAGDTANEIKNNALGAFSSQLRTVTNDDYLVRALSLPPEYGTLAKLCVEAQKLENLFPGEVPSVLDMYVLSYNNNRNLIPTSEATKRNLATYLAQYRNINDSIRILDAYIINIGVDFDIVTLPNYNSNQVLNNCILQLRNYFSIDNWQLKQPIYLKDLFILLDQVEGVQTVNNVHITNKTTNDGDYSRFGYDIAGATQNNIIYPSLDPSIFEVKYPNTDIKGRVVNF
jgi:hypothetical protein